MVNLTQLLVIFDSRGLDGTTGAVWRQLMFDVDSHFLPSCWIMFYGLHSLNTYSWLSNYIVSNINKHVSEFCETISGDYSNSSCETIFTTALFQYKNIAEAWLIFHISLSFTASCSLPRPHWHHSKPVSNRCARPVKHSSPVMPFSV